MLAHKAWDTMREEGGEDVGHKMAMKAVATKKRNKKKAAALKKRRASA